MPDLQGEPMSDMERARANLSAIMLAHGPLCPADLDPDAWAAVMANYNDDGGWVPGPEYHTEYRDARVAVQTVVSKVVKVLREMNAKQYETSENGGSEVAWWYWRDSVEDALGLKRGALASENELFESIEERDERDA